MKLNKRYRYKTTPLVNKEAIVQGEKYRFTILTSRLIRIEYNENGVFEDRATKTVINRQFDVVPFSVEKKGDIIEITTDDVMLTYNTSMPFSKNSLNLRYAGNNKSCNAGCEGTVWFFGEEQKYQLKGTTQTLDRADGEIELEGSIMSVQNITVLDDSKSFIITDDGWIEPRKEDLIDQYLFCYGAIHPNNGTPVAGFHHLECLKAFYHLTGKQPLIPRYALGNWWSRYHKYTQEEYTDLVKRFKEEDIPFSVSVIDMDWHLTKIDEKYGTGWTGYTWNKELFPDHVGFMKFLHDEGYKVTLNLHPQQGIAAHEDAYKDMAEAMGIDPKTEKNVEFDITNPKFLENYFTKVHHPLEDEGVDFWWMDWQQGNTTGVEGIEPLWMLNHYHYIDNGRNGNRPMLFSRYSGPGSHRYPLGFSGDTVISWASLDFQPYFTASATNIGYGWWSHDIGGHTGGTRDEELATRWYQFGAFSPINRLHSSNSLFLGKEPWKYNKISEISMKKFLKLRHELIPYIYSMNYRSHFHDDPLIQPLFYKYPENESRKNRNEYTFGTEMIVSPITRPHDNDTTLGSSEVYLPDGVWYDFFTNMKYTGKRYFTAYRDMYEMPVFVKAGGIIPMAKLTHTNDIDNPENMKIKVYTGASGTFELYEDDGITNEYQNGKYAITKIELNWSEKPAFTIHSPEGDTSVIPKKRNYEIELIGINEDANITVTNNGKVCNFTTSWNDGVLTVCVNNISGELKIGISNKTEYKNDISNHLLKLIEHSAMDNNKKDALYKSMISNELSIAQKLIKLYEFDLAEDMKKAVIEIITADTI